MADRLINYPSQNPESTLQNLGARFTRVGLGVWLRDALGSALGGGVFTNIAVNPSGLYVTAGPASSNHPAALYQALAEDAAIPTGSSNQLAADPTVVVLQGLQEAVSGNIGPVTVPGVGLSVYYLLEAQVQTVDQMSATLTFISSSGSRSTSNLPTARQDIIAYQLKAGTPASSPTVPSVDSGWVPIATVFVTHGDVSLDGADISMYPAFVGFLPTAQALPTRTSVTVTTPSLAASASAFLNVSGVRSYALIGVSTTSQAAILVYKNQAERTADASRPLTTPPAPGSGVVFQGTTTPGNLSIDCSPEPWGSSSESPPTDIIPISVINTAGTTATISVTLTYLPLEA